MGPSLFSQNITDLGADTMLVSSILPVAVVYMEGHGASSPVMLIRNRIIDGPIQPIYNCLILILDRICWKLKIFMMICVNLYFNIFMLISITSRVCYIQILKFLTFSILYQQIIQPKLPKKLSLIQTLKTLKMKTKKV